MDLFRETSLEEIEKLVNQFKIELNNQMPAMDIDSKIDLINRLREIIHDHSPFKAEPVDNVQWVKNDLVHANNYNPNSVAPPEMQLLKHSILCDGYTQPIVAFPENDMIEVIDGFHRNRVGKEDPEVKLRVHGYLPVVIIKSDRQDRNDRIAATVRHNRARGKHSVDGMSDIVVELKRRNWSDEKIGNELGMEPDEVLRLAQISGLAEIFADKEFSEAWEAESFDESLAEEIFEINEENE
jgi:ParB-like chromosome segregation protein Spo0J